ncbi:MAG TPA: ABC transporter permease [Gemmatimonadaceae bacterium]
MGRRIAARVGQAIVVLWVVATLAFVLIHAAPGDPFGFDAPNMTPAVRAQQRAQFGYDKPLPTQYARWLTSAARGDFGYSLSLHEHVRDAIADALPRTLLLMGVAIVASFALGIALALFQVRFRETRRARWAGNVALLFYSVPDFWLALVMLLLFAYWIPILPAGHPVDPVMHQYMGPLAAALDHVTHLILPALTLTLLTTAGVSRFQRSELLDVLPLDFVRTARAKGLDERSVLRRHVLRNALIPTITLFGLALPALLGGSVFVEKIFSWQGMGWITVNAIGTRDYPLVLAGVMVGTVLVVVGSLVADLAYAVVDPRLRVG